jgi:hypothetical protein
MFVSHWYWSNSRVTCFMNLDHGITLALLLNHIVQLV